MAAQSSRRIRSFDHVALPMQNTEAMQAFYRGLGLPVTESANAVSVYIGEQMIISIVRPCGSARRSPCALWGRGRRAGIYASPGKARLGRRTGIMLIEIEPSPRASNATR